jgi:hypothetical protein
MTKGDPAKRVAFFFGVPSMFDNLKVKVLFTA